jgi:hypothetical protein
MSKRAAPHVGVCEVFAQSAVITYHRGAEEVRHMIHVPPRILQNQSSSTIYTAVATGCPDVSIDSLVALSKACCYILLVEFPDGASPNKRKMFFQAALLPKNVLFIPGVCSVHAAHRLMSKLESLGGRFTLIGDVYAAKFVMHLSSHYNRMYRVLRDIVFEELVILPREAVSDADFEAWRIHAASVLEHTVFRKARHTRGRLDGFAVDDADLSDGKKAAGWDSKLWKSGFTRSLPLRCDIGRRRAKLSCCDLERRLARRQAPEVTGGGLRRLSPFA